MKPVKNIGLSWIIDFSFLQHFCAGNYFLSPWSSTTLPGCGLGHPDLRGPAGAGGGLEGSR